MMQFFLTIWRKQRLRSTRKGSALLVALLVMGVLLTLMLGLSYLVVREIRSTGDIVLSGKAYFSAESGVEEALYDLGQNLPGYETVGLAESQEGWVAYEPKEVSDDLSGGQKADEQENKLLSADLNYRYRIDNKGDAVPYFEDDQPIFLRPDYAVSKPVLYEFSPEETYNVLALNETVTIPLFTDNGNGSYDDVENFLVQYYVDFDVDTDAPQFQGRKIVLENFDILRWKLFGNPRCLGGATTCLERSKTEAISDFFPAHSNDDPLNPVCIGSDTNLLNGQVGGVSYSCKIPVARDITEGAFGGTGVEEAALEGSWSMARECYLNDAGGLVAAAPVQKKCLISTFIQNHTRNYITLTNVVNPDIVGVSNPELRNARANIYYRVVANPSGPQLVRDAAHIRSDGYAGQNGEIVQSIDTSVTMSSFLPVFNFSLYRTDTSDDLDAPEGGRVSEPVGGGLGSLGI